MKFENFIKGPLTSAFGLASMIAAGIGFWIDHLTDLQAGALGVIGFALIFMRDQLPGFVARLFNKKLGDGKGDESPKP